MGKKKHAEHVNHERWLVSYADLLTLLFAFFVVLFASSVADKKKSTAMAAAMQSAFSNSGAFDAHAKTPPLDAGAGNSQGTPTPLMTPLPTTPEGGDGAKAMEHSIKKATSGDALQGAVSVHASTDGTTISLNDAGLFASGSGDLRPEALGLLKKIAANLPNGDLRIEGHTDNQPIHSDRFRSNFELSTARAAAVTQALLEVTKITPSHFALAGYGEFRPAASNGTMEGRAKNRRVDIVVLHSAPVSSAGSSSGSSVASQGTMLPIPTEMHAAKPSLREQLESPAQAR